MGEWDWVFFYNEKQNNVESVTTFHQLDCDMGSLAEAHPEVIYFYAEFGPLREWDFNEVAYMPVEPWTGLVEVPEEPPFDVGVDHGTIYVLPDGQEFELDFTNIEGLELHSISIGEGPNAWGYFIHMADCPAVDLNVADEDVRCKCRPEREPFQLEDTPEKHVASNPGHRVSTNCSDCYWTVQSIDGAVPTAHPYTALEAALLDDEAKGIESPWTALRRRLLESHCRGYKGCRAKKHANDCPEWHE